LARNIVEGVSVTLSPKIYFVNVGMQLSVTPTEREQELRKTQRLFTSIIRSINSFPHKNDSSSDSFPSFG
jgi:hypothetical protein